MPFITVAALYDGKQVYFLEKVPVEGPYRVMVTFVAPAHNEVEHKHDEAAFWRSFGAWTDDRPVKATLQDIHEARRSKVEPPAL